MPPLKEVRSLKESGEFQWIQFVSFFFLLSFDLILTLLISNNLLPEPETYKTFLIGSIINSNLFQFSMIELILKWRLQYAHYLPEITFSAAACEV